jgi:hypothetical protein
MAWADEAVMYDNLIYMNTSIPGSGSANSDNNEDLFSVYDTTDNAKPAISSPSSGQVVPVDPVTGRAVPIQLAWSKVGEGQGQINRWDLSIYDKASGSDAGTMVSNFTTSTASSPAVMSNALGGFPILLPNTTYVMRVRGDRTTGGTELDTAWSDNIEFTIGSGTQVQQSYAGPQILGPAGGATTSTSPGIAWAPVPGAVKYMLVLATDPGLTQTIAGTPVTLEKTSFQATGLDYGTTYFWGVHVVEPTPGVQTISTFTVMDEPAPPPAAPTTTVEVPPQPTPTVIVEAPPPAPSPEPAIPAVAIWVVIGVGAVLIIVIIVLIVRTRRPV